MTHEKICNSHGKLSEENIIVEPNKSAKRGYTLRCKLCKRNKDKKWSDKNKEYKVAYSLNWKKENRERYNAWERENRKRNPEKYKRYEENYIAKHGREKIRKMEIVRIHKLTIQEYDEMFEKQKHVCLICKQVESRIGRDSKTICPLVVDHCHYCEQNGNHVIRGLLCHSCNILLGKAKDNINILQSAIKYLQSHQHKEVL